MSPSPYPIDGHRSVTFYSKSIVVSKQPVVGLPFDLNLSMFWKVMPLPKNSIFWSEVSRFVSSLEKLEFSELLWWSVIINNKQHQPWALIQLNSHWEFHTRSAYKSISLNLMTFKIPNALQAPMLASVSNKPRLSL